jgi:putative membrane protein
MTMPRTKPYLRAICGLSLAGALLIGCGDDDDEESVDSGNGTRVDAGTDASVRSDGGLDASADIDATIARDAAAAIDGATFTEATVNDAAITLSEPQVVGVAAASNTGEIDLANLALTRAQSGAARDYAAMMVSMHTAAQQRQNALGIQPQPSTQQALLTMTSNTAKQTLQNTAAPLFDVAYLDTQVAAHTVVRNLIDEVLLPSATTPALRTELTTTRGEVVAHLELAQRLSNTAADGGLPTSDGGTTDGGP